MVWSFSNFKPSMWIGFIPEWVVSFSHMSAVTLVRLNGLFEVVTGFLLAVGLWVRPMATLLFAHLLSIVFAVGLNSLGVRDAGLSFAMLAVVLNGNDVWCFGNKKEKTKQRSCSRECYDIGLSPNARSDCTLHI